VDFYSLETDVKCQFCGQVFDLEIRLGPQTMAKIVQAFQDFRKKDHGSKIEDNCGEEIDDSVVPPCAIERKPKQKQREPS